MNNIDTNRKKELDELANAAIEKMVDEYILDADEYGGLWYEMPTDNDDIFDLETISGILDSEHRESAFCGVLMDYELESSWDYSNQVDSKFIDLIDGFHGLPEAEQDYLMCAIGEVSYVFDRDSGEQMVPVNLIVDIEDSNADFTYSPTGEEEDFSEFRKTAWMWLAKQQGYTEEQVYDALINREFGDSKFLKSLHEEFLNTSSEMNALTFMVSVPLMELIRLNDEIDAAHNEHRYYADARSDRGTVTVPKDTMCGFVDFWQGAGSVLDIRLEKNVVIPIKYLDSALPDGDRGGYGIKSIYGMSDYDWYAEVEIDYGQSNMEKRIAQLAEQVDYGLLDPDEAVGIAMTEFLLTKEEAKNKLEEEWDRKHFGEEDEEW